MAHVSKPAGPAPTRGTLHEAALRYLARFATTRQGLTRVLERRVLRWGQRAASEGVDIEGSVAAGRLLAREVAQALVAAGAVNDETFASARAARLLRSGRSRRAVAAHLGGKGVEPDMVATVLPDALDELPSALAYAKRRRIGPFRGVSDDATTTKDMGALARAGFSRDVAERAMRMPVDDADALVIALKQG